MRCGAEFNNTICPFGWCSKYNWCGVSKLHKATHQIAYDAKKACQKKTKAPVKKVLVKKAPVKKVVVKKAPVKKAPVKKAAKKTVKKVVIKAKKVTKKKPVKKVVIKAKKVTKKKPVKKVVIKAKKVTKKTAKKTVKKVVKKKAHKKVIVRIHGLKTTLKCKVSKNMRCGAEFNNTICPFGWCSKWNWCGVSKLHKSTHQIAYDAKKECSANKKLVL